MTKVWYSVRSAAGALRTAGAAACLALAFGTPASAETRGYVISWFATATHNSNYLEACPENRNGGQMQVAIRDLIQLGYTQEEAEKIQSGQVGFGRGVREKVTNRAIVNGQGKSIYNYPDATKDPNIEMVTGPYAWGFDLDGKNDGKEFTDPETKQKVDNQLWRAVGCSHSFRATPPVMPYPEELAWQAMVDSAPGWLIQITGEDLSKDGPVTLTFDRSTRHPVRDAAGDVLRNATYVIDPAPRSHNVLQGEIKNGILTIKPGASIYLEAQMPYYSEIAMKGLQMRVRADAKGKLIGLWGGYVDWVTWIYMYTARSGNNADTMGLYHAVKKMADADPDPKTGQNRAISTTWRMEAVPAYIATTEGKIIAKPGLLTGAQTADKMYVEPPAAGIN